MEQAESCYYLSVWFFLWFNRINLLGPRSVTGEMLALIQILLKLKRLTA